MSRTEQVIAAILLAIAVAGGALLPRLLSAPARPFGIALGPGPGRSVIHAQAIPKAPGRAAVPHPTQPQAQVTAGPVAPVVPVAAQPTTKPSAALFARMALANAVVD